MNRISLEYYARKYGLATVIVFALIVFVLPLILRITAGSPITPGSQSYAFLRHADLLHAGSIGADPLHGALAPNPYTILISIMQVFGAPWLLPPLLGILLLVLLFSFLNRFVSAQAVVVLSLIIVVLSPGMSILATHHTPILLCMVFITLMLLSFPHHPFIGSLMLGLAMITSPVLGVVAALVLAVVFFRNSHYHELTAIVTTSACVWVWFFFWQDIPVLHELLAPSFNASIFFELGNGEGVSIFLLILAGYGVAVNKSKDFVLYTVLTLGASLFVSTLLPIVVVALAVFAAQGIYHLVISQWELQLLQSSLLILITCIGLFLLITTVRERVVESPDADFSHVMITLRNQYHEGAVLTDPSYAPMIEYFAGRRAALSSETAQDIVELLLFARSPNTAYPIMVERDVSYVLITNEMQQNLFANEEGILFLVHNSQRFVLVKETEANSLWFFIRPTV
jgi:hypothetical protein